MASWPGVACIALFGLSLSVILMRYPRRHLREARVPGIYSDSESTTNKIRTARASLMRDEAQQIARDGQRLEVGRRDCWSLAAQARPSPKAPLCGIGSTQFGRLFSLKSRLLESPRRYEIRVDDHFTARAQTILSGRRNLIRLEVRRQRELLRRTMYGYHDAFALVNAKDPTVKLLLLAELFIGVQIGDADQHVLADE